ncbi:MAG: phosphatidylglycerophosphatase A [candidate division NC10 bacterium]|nr:phosphatidylglycerophosphatase A [candidate division NC10 bacterium]
MTWWGNAWVEWQQKQVGSKDLDLLSRGRGRRWVVFLASAFLAGFLPYVPGTAGTLVGLFLYLLFLHRIPSLAYLVLLVLLMFVGSWLCGQAEADLGKKDAAPIVWDEMVGFLASVALLPYRLWILGAAFFLFRLLDITKPPPIRRVQCWKGGWGVMADDLMAALYANLFLRILLWLTGG